MEVPAAFIFFVLVLVVGMSISLGWVLARRFQPLGSPTNITWFSGAACADPNLTAPQSPQRVRPVAEAADSQSAFLGSPVLDGRDLLPDLPGTRDAPDTRVQNYWINPRTNTMHKHVSPITGTERNLCCGSKQPRRLEKVHLCEFCWPIEDRKYR